MFALPNKIGLPQEQYFLVQSIYRGWALFGIVLFGALALELILAILTRASRAAGLFALAGFALTALTLVIFFVWVYPANVATENWTAIPANWASLRRQWEFGHAVNAAISLAAFMSVALSILTARR